MFPREAAANRGIFYAQGQPCSAQAVLDRLNLDAGASIEASPSAPTRRLEYASGDDGMMSPALAQALFNIALLPLLSSSEEPDDTQRDPTRALMAYARQSLT